jgi:hypothetical protein
MEKWKKNTLGWLFFGRNLPSAFTTHGTQVSTVGSRFQVWFVAQSGSGDKALYRDHRDRLTVQEETVVRNMMLVMTKSVRERVCVRYL